jgi:hypothetical protein
MNDLKKKHLEKKKKHIYRDRKLKMVGKETDNLNRNGKHTS